MGGVIARASTMAALFMFAACGSSPVGTTDAAAGSGGSTAGIGGANAGSGAVGGSTGTGGTSITGAGGDPSIPSVSVSFWPFTSGATATLAPVIRIFNHGPRNLPMTEMAMRYWFTSDIAGAAGVTQTVECWSTQGIVCEGLTTSLVSVSPVRPLADSYVNIDFAPSVASVGAGGWAEIMLHIARSDGGTYDQSNDYSYTASTSLTETTRVTVYYRGALLYGVEP
jgi:hypothetical protein